MAEVHLLRTCDESLVAANDARGSMVPRDGSDPAGAIYASLKPSLRTRLLPSSGCLVQPATSSSPQLPSTTPSSPSQHIREPSSPHFSLILSVPKLFSFVIAMKTAIFLAAGTLMSSASAGGVHKLKLSKVPLSEQLVSIHRHIHSS